MNNGEAIKSTQEQALASWITYLNQVRLDTLIEKLNQQDINLEEALKELNEIKQFINNPSHILGSDLTKHGEIAEHMQVKIENARRLIQGLKRNHTFDGVGRTAPEDYLRNDKPVQSKFYNGLKQTLFNKHGVMDHLKKYPDFVKNGGSYDIPKDQYEKLVDLIDKFHNNPSQLSASEYYLAKKIVEFLEKNGLKLGEDICPAVVDYGDVQTGKANDTVDKEEENIKNEDKKQRDKAYQESKPHLKEAAKAIGIGAIAEGGVAFGLAVAEKRKSKTFNEFTVEDWKEIGIVSSEGALKGGIRGGAVYALSNYTATPANVASAYVTAAFGISAQVKQLEEGNVSKEDFIINCETICLDVTVSTIASLAGQVVIPVPVLGAIIGNSVGQYVYGICKNVGNDYSDSIIKSYKDEISLLKQQLDIKYISYLIEIEKEFNRFKDMESLAFDVNVNIAFNSSVHLAREIGVDESKILTDIAKINSFFED